MTTVSFSGYESTSYSISFGGSFGFGGGFGGGFGDRGESLRSERSEGFGRFGRFDRSERFGNERSGEARENFRSRFEDTISNIEDAAVIIDQLDAFASALQDGGISDAIAAYRQTGEQAQLTLAAQAAGEEGAEEDAVEETEVAAQTEDNIEAVADAVDAEAEAATTVSTVVETSESSLSVALDDDGLSIEASTSSSTVTTTEAPAEEAAPVAEAAPVEEAAVTLLEDAAEEDTAPVAEDELVGEVLPAQSDISGLIGSILDALQSGLTDFEATFTQTVSADGFFAETGSTLSIQQTEDGLTASLLSSSTVQTENGSSTFLSELTFSVSDDAVSFSEVIFQSSEATVGNATVATQSYQATSAYASLTDDQSVADSLTELVSAA